MSIEPDLLCMNCGYSKSFHVRSCAANEAAGSQCEAKCKAFVASIFAGDLKRRRTLVGRCPARASKRKRVSRR